MANNGENLNSSNDNNNESAKWDDVAKSINKMATNPFSGVEKMVAEKLKNHPAVRGAIAGFVAGFILASAGYENENNASKAEDVNRVNNMTKVESNQETVVDGPIEGVMALAGEAVASQSRAKGPDAHSGGVEVRITSSDETKNFVPSQPGGNSPQGNMPIIDDQVDSNMPTIDEHINSNMPMASDDAVAGSISDRIDQMTGEPISSFETGDHGDGPIGSDYESHDHDGGGESHDRDGGGESHHHHDHDRGE